MRSIVLKVLDRLGIGLRRAPTASEPIIGNCVATGPSLAQAPLSVPPMVGACVSTGDQRVPAQEPPSAIMGRASPHAVPVVTIRRGTAYAERFAADFVAWVRRSTGRPIKLTVDDLRLIARRDFAAALSIPIPPDRSLLAAIQKMDGIEVRHHVRGYKADGGKTTVYTIKPVEMATDAATPTVSGAPLPRERLAA